MNECNSDKAKTNHHISRHFFRTKNLNNLVAKSELRYLYCFLLHHTQETCSNNDEDNKLLTVY